MRSIPAMYSSASWLTIGFKPCFSRKPSDGSLLPAAKLSVLLGSLGGPDATILIGVVFLSFFVNLISFRHECCYMVGEQSNHLQNFEDSQTLRILYQPVRIAMSCSFLWKLWGADVCRQTRWIFDICSMWPISIQEYQAFNGQQWLWDCGLNSWCLCFHIFSKATTEYHVTEPTSRCWSQCPLVSCNKSWFCTVPSGSIWKPFETQRYMLCSVHFG